MSKNEEREKFGSRLGFILVSAGCAVGLGNVWKFPYICGQNGGAAFILIYLLFLVILGWPILVCEFAIGRGSGKSLGSALEGMEPKGSAWHWYKWPAFAGNYALMMFYTMVAGWMIHYAVLEVSGVFHKKDTQGIIDTYSKMQADPKLMLFWTFVVILACIGVCALGLNNGVEKISKVLMLLLITLMLVLAVNSVTMKGAGEGLKFYLLPDFKKMAKAGIGNVVFAAMTQAFFTLSIGMGSMEIFGSFLNKDRKLAGEAGNIVVLDTFVALMAGIIIIPACFAYGMEPTQGPKLLFVTLPQVFVNMPGGRIWGALFFCFMAFAALTTVIAVFQNIITMTIDNLGWERKKALLVNLFGIMILSIPAVLGFNVWKGIQPMGTGSTIMDLEDFIVSSNVLPLGSFLCVLFCCKKNGWGFDNFRNEADQGKGKNFPAWVRPYMTYVLPLIILVIYFKGYYDLFHKKGTLVFAIWMGVAVLFAGFVVLIANIRLKPKNK